MSIEVLFSVTFKSMTSGTKTGEAVLKTAATVGW